MLPKIYHKFWETVSWFEILRRKELKGRKILDDVIHLQGSGKEGMKMKGKIWLCAELYVLKEISVILFRSTASVGKILTTIII